MRILLATDGTVHSNSAIESVRLFNLKSGDEIKIISVVDLAVPLAVDIYTGYLPSTIEIENAARENAKSTLEKARQNLEAAVVNSKILISSEVLIGSPESRIVETAEEFKADLIIVGSHGYNSWERLLLGSVSDSVIHHAPCSVFVVRTKKD